MDIRSRCASRVLKYSKKSLQHLRMLFNVYLIFIIFKMKVVMKNVVKCCKDFLGYSNILETHREMSTQTRFCLENRKSFLAYSFEAYLILPAYLSRFQEIDRYISILMARTFDHILDLSNKTFLHEIVTLIKHLYFLQMLVVYKNI